MPIVQWIDCTHITGNARFSLKPYMFTPAIFTEPFCRTIQAWGYHGFLPKTKLSSAQNKNLNQGDNVRNYHAQLSAMLETFRTANARLRNPVARTQQVASSARTWATKMICLMSLLPTQETSGESIIKWWRKLLNSDSNQWIEMTNLFILARFISNGFTTSKKHLVQTLRFMIIKAKYCPRLIRSAGRQTFTLKFMIFITKTGNQKTTQEEIRQSLSSTKLEHPGHCRISNDSQQSVNSCLIIRSF